MSTVKAQTEQAGVTRFLAGCVRVVLHPFRSEIVYLPPELRLSQGDWVVFGDETGDELGEIAGKVEDTAVSKTVRRKATPADMERRAAGAEVEGRALMLFQRYVREFRLPMKPVAAHLSYDQREMYFYFVAQDRINFRALHKAISAALNMKVVIRQVGVRDYTRTIGGLGPCGRELCCSSLGIELRPITLRMARQQNLFVEPGKISGFCGKLLCCLGFEAENYANPTEAGQEESAEEGLTIE